MTGRSQKPSRVFLFFFPLFLSTPAFALPQSYPQNQVDRPLTLPMGTVEIGAGAAMTQWGKTTDGGMGHESGYEPIHPSLSLRYGRDTVIPNSEVESDLAADSFVFSSRFFTEFTLSEAKDLNDK